MILLAALLCNYGRGKCLIDIGTEGFVRRYLERNSQPPLSLRQIDPLIRQLHLYRDLIQERTQEPNP